MNKNQEKRLLDYLNRKPNILKKKKEKGKGRFKLYHQSQPSKFYSRTYIDCNDGVWILVVEK